MKKVYISAKRELQKLSSPINPWWVKKKKSNVVPKPVLDPHLLAEINALDREYAVKTMPGL